VINMAFLELDNVHFTYPKAKQEIIRGVSIIIEKGEAVALMGPNASGKTTIGKIMVGIYKPTKGRVMLNDRDISQYNLGEVGKKIGYIFQNPEKQLFSPTVEEEIGFGLHFRGMKEELIQEKVEEMLIYFDLVPKRKEFPFNLSQGEKQRLAMAAAFALEPDFMIMDEPTTGLDVKRKNKLIELLFKVKAKGTGYMVISHDDEFCKRVADRILFLKDGRIS